MLSQTQTQIQKQVMSTESSKPNESEDCDKKRSGKESNSKRPISSNDTSIVIPNVKLPTSKSTQIESSSPSFLSLESLILNTTIKTEDQLLDKKQYLPFIEDKSFYCKDHGSLKKYYNTDKHSEVEENSNPNKKLPTHQEKTYTGNQHTMIIYEQKIPLLGDQKINDDKSSSILQLIYKHITTRTSYHNSIVASSKVNLVHHTSQNFGKLNNNKIKDINSNVDPDNFPQIQVPQHLNIHNTISNTPHYSPKQEDDIQ